MVRASILAGSAQERITPFFTVETRRARTGVRAVTFFRPLLGALKGRLEVAPLRCWRSGMAESHQGFTPALEAGS